MSSFNSTSTPYSLSNGTFFPASKTPAEAEAEAAGTTMTSLTSARGVILEPVKVHYDHDASGISHDSSSSSNSSATSPTEEDDFAASSAAKAHASSAGAELWRSAASVMRPRAGSVTPRHEHPVASDHFQLDRGPGTPDFTLDRFEKIRGKREHTHSTQLQQELSARSLLRFASDGGLLPSHMSSPPSSPSSPEPYARIHESPSSRRTLSAWTSTDVQQTLNVATSAVVAHMRSFICAAKMPPLRPHVPALFFLMTAFVGSTLCILLALSTLPLRLPSHITDLTLTEIRDMSLSLRTYSRSSMQAFLHTLCVLGAFFTWKQAFTVPGSIIMNVVFGAMYGTWMGTLYTSLLTAVGGMLCYLLMAPLGPLISTMPGLNKALQKMQTALRGSMTLTEMHAPIASRTTQRSAGTRGLLHERTHSHASRQQHSEARATVRGPANASSSARQSGAGSSRTANLWSYLLVLRLLPVVPYGLMNIACSVLRVPLLPYTVTLGLGSIPWNACTVQIGDLLVEVVSALPAVVATPNMNGSQSGADALLGTTSSPAVNANAQSGLRAISDKIWNREMMFRLALMSIVSMAPMLLQRWLKRRNDAALAAGDEYDDDVVLQSTADEDDLLDRQRALEDGSERLPGLASGTESGDVDADGPNHSNMREPQTYVQSPGDSAPDRVQSVHTWRASWHPGNVDHQSHTLVNDRSSSNRHSVQMTHVALKEHRRSPPIKRAVAHAIL